MRSAGHDPIVQAGAMFCPKCGRVAFPVDAARLDDARIIATYPGACGHLRGGTVVLAVDDLAAEPVGPLLAAYVPGRRCIGRNRFGRPCRAYACPGSDFCHAHATAWTTRDPA
jgi:hypothetical protein